MTTSSPPLDLRARRDVGDLLSTTFSVFFAHSAVFFTLALVVVAPVTILVDGVLGRQLADGLEAQPPAGVQVLSILLGNIVVPTLVTALHVVVVQRLAEGKAPTVGAALRAGSDRFAPALAAVLLYTLVVVLGFVALIIPGIYLAIRLYFAAQAAVVDRASPADALRRSSELTKDQWWRCFGYLLLSGFVFAILAGIAGLLLGFLAAALDSGVILVVLQVLVLSVTLSLTALFGTLLFFDLRMRREGGGGGEGEGSGEWSGQAPLDPRGPERL